ncbi:MAG: tetratricopeptide repeat protein, partial [Terriglobales bacterium]
DPGFAVAYSRLGETYSALGSDSEAEQASRRAMELSEKLPMAAKYMIEASHARIAKDNRKAIEAYENLAKSFPDDNDIQFALGSLYLDTGDLDKARAHYGNVLKADPKNLNALLAAGWLEVRSGNAQAGLDPLNRALSLAIQVDNQEEKAQILQATGVAYEGMNKPDEALRNLQQSLDINRQLGKKAGVANSLVEIGHVENLLGKPDAALASFTEALKLERQIGVKKDAADTLIDMGVLFEERGQYDKALQNYKESLQTQRDVGDESNQAICLNNIGNVYLAQGKNDDALTYYQQALQLREKLNVPGDIADTLHNLGETYAKTAQYDSAMASYMRALDLRRKSGDAHGAALESHSIGMVFIYQGRYGAAVNSLREAVKGFHDLKDRTRTMAQILSDYADALAQAGRGEEAGKSLAEAQGLARGLKNDNLMADILNTQGDLRFYRGDVKAAKDLYQQALQTASRVKAGDKILVSKFNLAKADVAEGQAKAALSNLRQVANQADTLGLKYLSVDCSVYMAQAMINGKDYSRARQELEQPLGTSEKLGLRMLTVRIHYLLGTSARLSGDAGEAANQYRQAASLLDEMKKEPGAEHLLERSDLKAIYAEAGR